MNFSQNARTSDLNQDFINRQTWQQSATIRSYVRLRGWTDPGEQVALALAAAEVREQPILDIGVGAGRTTSLLRNISQNYIGIDYTPQMVEACRATHPDTQILLMDARDLSAFEKGQFSLAMFSFNGIDAVHATDRKKVLSEVHRVLKPGGLFVFSAHNRHGPGHAEKPGLHLQFSWNPFKLAWRCLRMLRSLPLSLRNHRRYRAVNETHDEWSVMNCAAHNFGIVAMYTTLAEQVRQLAAAGFQTELVLDNVNGRPVDESTEATGVWWFHYVARKPSTPAMGINV